MTDEPRTGTENQAETRVGERGWRLQHMPILLGASAVLIAGAAVLGLILAGPTGAAGAAAGVAVVSLSYTISTLVIAKADELNPRLILPWGLGTYIAKFSLIGVVMSAVASAGWSGLVPLGWGVIVGVVGWTGTHIWWITRIYQDPTMSDPQAGIIPIGRPVVDRSSPAGHDEE